MARQRVQKKAAWGLPSSVRPVVCVPAQASSGQAAGEDVMWREGPVAWHTAPALSQKHFGRLEGHRWVPWALCLSHRACQRWPGQEA